MSEKNINTASCKNPIHNRRLLILIVTDILLLIIAGLLIIGYYPSSADKLSPNGLLYHFCLLAVCLFGFRCFFSVYKQIWRYGGSSAYLHLILSDAAGGVLYYLLQRILPFSQITFIHSFSITALELLFVLSTRLVYQYLYEYSRRRSSRYPFLSKHIRFLIGLPAGEPDGEAERENKDSRIRIAIVGAGRVGVMLAEELMDNEDSEYVACCFIDTDHLKAGREVNGIPVYPDDEACFERLRSLAVQEIVFALPRVSSERKQHLYEHYKGTGCRLKVYDYPTMQTTDDSKRRVREFAIEDLLFRPPVEFSNTPVAQYYRDKVILITGGGGSIGSELCRQIAKMKPKKLIILDVYENGAYDIQQELLIARGSSVTVCVEIVSVCDRDGLEKVMEKHRPEIVLHAAAHKHVPLMEKNCCEAVKNNVFGTLNTVELSEKYGVKRFIMISTDKAVNPTNVMGATKRMCEMLIQSRSSTDCGTLFCATRFGNVLGSQGSVIPLFKKQIQNGGPVTITDKRIIRYFMTIPEASQLVLESGALAKNGELYVLDMGKPIRILELAESMIRLSGYEPYKDIRIEEIGLRPGEKLYEELLIRPEEMDRTSNERIFVERAEPLSWETVSEKLEILRQAVRTEDDAEVRRALERTVETFTDPTSVNKDAENTREMQMAQ